MSTHTTPYPDHNTRRLNAPPAQGRARLHPDTAAYVAALGQAATNAQLEHDTATAIHAYRLTVAPLVHHHPVETTPGHAARLHPPTTFHDTLIALDAQRAYTLRGLATYHAQWYVHGAITALEAMLRGNQFTPHHLEILLGSRNAHRPVREVEATMPHYGDHNRPRIPVDPRYMATGHADLDEAVANAWHRLDRMYRAAQDLEGLATNIGEAPPLNPAPNHEGLDVTRLYVDLVKFGHAVADAAEYGHGVPTA